MRDRKVELLSRLTERNGAVPSLLDGVVLLRGERSCVPVPVLYEPCVVIVVQGQKRFHLPDAVLHYDPEHFFLVTVPVPADCETLVGADGPFLGLAVRIDLGVVAELLLMMGPCMGGAGGSRRSVGAFKMTPEMDEVALRLLECLGTEQEARVLGPSRVRELLFELLRGDAGGELRSILEGTESRAAIHRVLQRVHLQFALPLDVAGLAREAGMSVSTFHAHFRQETGTSPVQYVKVLRLHKARMLMVQESAGAAVASARVGYDSASQFSREFRRLFGAPPADEARRVRAAFGFADTVSPVPEMAEREARR